MELKILSPEAIMEIDKHYNEGMERVLELGGEDLTATTMRQGLNAYLQAQARRTLQQVVGWGEEDCPHNKASSVWHTHRRECTRCWQELKELANET